MEEPTLSFPVLYAILNWFVLGGGSIVAVYVWHCHHRNPPNRATCTETIASRAWDSIHAGQLLLAIMLLYLLASFSGMLFHEDQLPLGRLVVTVSIYSILIAIIHDMTRRTGSWKKTFGMGLHNLKVLRLAPVLYLAIIPFVWAATQTYQWVLVHFFGQELTVQDAVQAITTERSWLELGYILTAVVGAPIYEELVFRGILFPYLAKRIGLRGSVVAVSALFALIHFHLPSALPLFMLSAALCIAYWRTGSLWVSIGIHAIFNGVTALAIKLAY